MQSGRLFCILAISTPHVRRRRKGLGGVSPTFFYASYLTEPVPAGRRPGLWSQAAAEHIPASGRVGAAPGRRGSGDPSRNRRCAEVCGSEPRARPEQRRLQVLHPALPDTCTWDSVKLIPRLGSSREPPGKERRVWRRCCGTLTPTFSRLVLGPQLIGLLPLSAPRSTSAGSHRSVLGLCARSFRKFPGSGVASLSFSSLGPWAAARGSENLPLRGSCASVPPAPAERLVFGCLRLS